MSGAPIVTQRVAPVYPEAAKGHGVEAVVTLNVTVGTAGEVTNVEVVRTRLTTERDVTDPTFWASQPSKLFGQAAEDAVRQWRFEPTGATRRFELPVAIRRHRPRWHLCRSGAADVQAVHRNAGVVTCCSGRQTCPNPVGGAIRPAAHGFEEWNPYTRQLAKAANIQGVVILELVIDTDGSVKEGHVLRSIPLLDQAALDAVVQWRYQPTLLNGAPVEVIATVTVNFTLPEEQR